VSRSTRPPIRRVALQSSTRSTDPLVPTPTPSTKPANPTRLSPTESLLRELRVNKYHRGPLSMVGANFTSAADALWANRGRSFLTVLGIFIGVAAVLAALTLTQGTSAYINNEVASLGTSVIVTPGNAQSGGVSQGGSTLSTLTPKDAQALSTLPHVVAESPFIDAPEQVIYKNQNWSTTVEGVNTQVQTIQNWTVAQGAWFSSTDDAQGNAVAVLGDTVMHSLFDTSGDNPIGKQILIGQQPFRVVGVLKPQGGGFSNDDVIFVPLKAAQIRLNNTQYVGQIQVEVDEEKNVNIVAQEITTTLEQTHHILPGQTNDFTVQTFTFVLQRVGQVTQVLTYLLVGIAAISLTVGGIGIMNIMLVSVTERTWEIGIRMSIGAHRGDIRNQFLMEALVLCLVGGILGMGLGLVVGALITHLAGLPFVITVTSIALPVGVSTGIAIVFGLYPAIRASHLDPIEAIRSEE
jgi:putative ABC transport system permease protein